MGMLLNFLANFLSNLVTGLVGERIDIIESQKRGEAEAENAAHEDNAKRKEKADDILATPIKKGDDLLDSLHSRSDRD
jgi:hypothetical protein